MVQEEALIGVEVGHDHPQHVVGVPGHKVTLHDLRPFRHGALEGFEGRLDLPFQRNLDDDADRQPDAAGVEQRDVARDHALLLEVADPAPAGRRRNPDQLRQLDVAHPRVFLQGPQDTAVYLV